MIQVSPEEMYVTGGDPKPYRKTNWVLKLKKAGTRYNWHTLASMHIYRSSHGCALLENSHEIIVAGGYTKSYVFSNTMEIYNIAGNEWRIGTPLPPHLKLKWSYLSHENTLWIIGGGEGMVYKYENNAKEWVHQIGIKTSGIAAESVILLTLDNTLKCS